MKRTPVKKLTTRLMAAAAMAWIAVATAATAEAQRVLDSTPVLPIKDAVETLTKRWGQEGYSLVKEYYDNLEDASIKNTKKKKNMNAKTQFKVSFDTTPGREYVFAATASDGAADLALSLRDSQGAYSSADTRNIGDAFLRPPYISYPAQPSPTKIELTVTLVRGTRNYAVPVAILVYSRLK